MKIDNERQILSAVRSAVSGCGISLDGFVNTIGPLFEQFMQENKEFDEYKGWCFDLTFIRATVSECRPYLSGLSLESDSWRYFSEGKNGCIYAIPEKGIIKIHLHDFLWSQY